MTAIRDASGRQTSIVATDSASAVASSVRYGFQKAGVDQAQIQTRKSVKEQGVPANALTTYSYDSRNRVTRTEEKDGSKAYTWDFSYDNAGNRTRANFRNQYISGANFDTVYTYNAANGVLQRILFT